MKKRVTLIIVTAFIISSFIGFNNKSEISMLYRGEGDLWEVEFWFPEVISAYKIIRSDDVINNTNEYKSSQTINKKQLENMSTDIEFAVKWGDKTERIKVTKTR